MSTIEEKLWNYIDGTCSPAEHKAIASLIEQDEAYRNKYNELLKLNTLFNSIELEEPSMAFTYNVMENIRAENAAKPLHARVNNRIILAIAAFFIVTLAVLIVYAFTTINWAATEPVKIPMQLNVKMNEVNTFFTGPGIKAFLFLDVVTGLFLLDYYLRRKITVK